jgi:hypothetical protein
MCRGGPLRQAWSALVIVGLAAACSQPASAPVVVHVPDDLAAGASEAVTDLVTDLGLLTGQQVDVVPLPAAECVPGEIHIAMLGHEHGENGARVHTSLAPQEYEIREARCGDGHLITLRGGSLLAGQWAAYELMERLGVRYFHPEQTYYPAAPSWPLVALRVRSQPALWRRSLHAHTTHPIELSSPLAPGALDMERYQRHWIAWNVKVRSTEVDGWDAAVVGDYAYVRGFPRVAGFNLLNSQQGGRPIIDPDDPRPEAAQIGEAIDEQMAPVDGAPEVSAFGFQFNPSEFTVADEQRTVERLTFVTNYIAQRWPGVEVRTINHGTAQPNGQRYGVRFFDLSQLAPPALSVQVHPLMFYDLERAAPVYGNQSFAYLRDWIAAQQAVRRIHYYPESSWWLTFDLPVPLFLAPVTLEARDQDLRLLRPYLASRPDSATGVVGHHLFTSGQEWGYWLIDYCTARMTWDLELGWLGCLEHVTSALAEGPTLRRLLEEVGRAQVEPMRDPAILAMLAGSDDQTEAAALTGIVVHPLPPSPVGVLSWNDGQVAELQAQSLARMPAMAEQYRQWADAAAALVPVQSEQQAPWVQEIADGLRVTGLRAAHALEIYRGAVALRAAIRASDFAGVEAASMRVKTARAVTNEAKAIVLGREEAYRYPLALVTAGDELGTAGALPNQTVYPYRYLSRTHRMFYWTRPDAQLAAMFGADLELVTVAPDRILRAGGPFTVGLLVNQVSQLGVSWGDGQSATALSPHTYAAEGVYDWVLDVIHGAGALHHVDRAAVVSRRLEFPKASLKVKAPTGAALIEGLLPGLVVGLGQDSGGEFLVLGRIDGARPVVAKGTVIKRARSGLSSGPADLRMDLARIGGATVFGAVVTIANGSGADDRRLTITGELLTGELIQLLVDTGSFDVAGARAIIAATLGYTADTLPARVAFTIEAIGREP